LEKGKERKGVVFRLRGGERKVIAEQGGMRGQGKEGAL